MNSSGRVLISTYLGRRVCANPHVAPVAAKHLPRACSGADLARQCSAALQSPWISPLATPWAPGPLLAVQPKSVKEQS